LEEYARMTSNKTKSVLEHAVQSVAAVEKQAVWMYTVASVSALVLD